MVCKKGHANQAGGCCCHGCGNTCGYHHEYKGTRIPLLSQTARPAGGIRTIEQLAASSPEWERRLKKIGAIGQVL